MAQFLKPDNLNTVWASGGDRLYPGDTKYQRGWGVEIPPRQYFNEIDYKQDQMLAHLNQHGIAEWDAKTEYQANKSYVQGSSGTIFRCVLTHTNQDPELDLTSTYWTKPILTPEDLPQVATPEQARALVEDGVYLSPLQLNNAFSGPNQSKTVNGYQKFPGGLILQTGAVPYTDISTTLVSVVTFATPFPSLLTSLNLTVASNQDVLTRVTNVSKTGFTANIREYDTTVAGGTIYWQAWGY